jgi:hypothetical protein
VQILLLSSYYILSLLKVRKPIIFFAKIQS